MRRSLAASAAMCAIAFLTSGVPATSAAAKPPPGLGSALSGMVAGLPVLGPAVDPLAGGLSGGLNHSSGLVPSL
ncbi:hypothetical protein GCM10022221_19450 [Actinocorallia aurea]